MHHPQIVHKFVVIFAVPRPVVIMHINGEKFATAIITLLLYLWTCIQAMDLRHNKNYTYTAETSTNKDSTSGVHNRHTIGIEISTKTRQKGQLVVS